MYMNDIKIEEYKGNIAFFYRNSWNHRKRTLLADGTTKYSRVGGFKTPEEAEENYYKCLKEYEEQRRNYVVPNVDKDILLRDYLIYWYENIFSERILSNTSMITSYAIYNLIIPNLPYDIKLRLTTTDYINKTLEKIDKLGKTTANKSRQILSIAFKDAVRDKIISSNPVSSADLYKRGKPNIKILNKEEIKKLLEITHDSSWYLEILLALFCGLRKGEIRGLKFSDFDYENKTVTISRQLSAKYDMEKEKFKINKTEYVEKEPKTENSNRTLRVPSIIWEELEKRKMKIKHYKEINEKKFNDNGYVSCQCNGEPHCIASLNGFLRKKCKRFGLPDVSVHGLRHIYATILIEQGVQLAKISALLGHSSVHTTFDYYLDNIEEKQKIIAFVNNTFSVEEGEEKYYGN